ncbi:MAG: flagellar export chaperone FlgN [Verrucomicrobia bacterium]|nr:flagellar export chaperone FlgN [Verrucomicrobiota bacterium]
MTSTSENLASILVAEHDSLTELLRLLKEEQQIILQRRSEALIVLLSTIETQLLRVQHHRAEREEALRPLLSQTPAATAPVAGDSPCLARRIATLPDGVRDQAVPVAMRIDLALQLVHEIAWQNHVLLSHSLHFLEQVLAPWMDPQSQSLAIYSQHGIVRKGTRRQTLFHAIA